jgi:hypothetical protein
MEVPLRYKSSSSGSMMCKLKKDSLWIEATIKSVVWSILQCNEEIWI